MLYNWTVADKAVTALEEGKITEAIVGNKKISLLKYKGKIEAFAHLCPHAGAPLCDGWLDPSGRVVCPLHKYRFDPATGRNTSGEGYKLFKYPVELRGNEIWLGLRD